MCTPVRDRLTALTRWQYGANDASMLKLAAIGIAIMTAEGVATSALQAADLLVPGPAFGH
jgi:hypothetical protein